VTDLDALVTDIEAVAATRPDRRVLIGLAGAPAAGKTTLAEALVVRLAGAADWRGTRVAHVPMDGFHLADVELARRGLLDRKGVPATFDPSGYRALLERIRAGEEVLAPAFERTLEQPIAQSLPVTAATRIVISEGNYLLLPDEPWPAVRACFDAVWFVRTDEALRRRRLFDRHVEFGKTPAQTEAWMQAVDDPNAELVGASAAGADRVIDLS
jgi:pantothenate kinase